jgi:hypothetical protein
MQKKKREPGLWLDWTCMAEKLRWPQLRVFLADLDQICVAPSMENSPPETIVDYGWVGHVSP